MMLLLHPLLIITASHCHCSDAYASSPPIKSNYHHRWSSSRLFSTASSADVASSSTTTFSASSTTSEENITTRDILSLDYIRSTLIRQEETIIFALIERAQFRHNDIVYKVGGVPGLGVPPGSSGSSNMQNTDGGDEQQEELSFLDFMFIGTVSNLSFPHGYKLILQYYCSTHYICVLTNVNRFPFITTYYHHHHHQHRHHHHHHQQQQSYRRHSTASYVGTNHPRNMHSFPLAYQNEAILSRSWNIPTYYPTITQSTN